MAAASDLFKKPNVQVFETASRIQRQKPSKSCSSLLSKSLVIILVLVVIPLFPSQAPDFINQSIVTKFWELLHLMFIGIVVSYGLFSRRSVKMEVGNHSGPDTSHPYLSGISNVSSFFEDGLENVCVSDEKRVMHNLDPRYLNSESVFRGSSASDGGKKFRSFTLRNGSENISEADGENVSHIWNSQYLQEESLVVVTDGNFTLEEHKPLGLPIRSLRSRIPGAEKPQFANRNRSNSSSKSSSNNDSEGSVEKIRGMTPTNLHNKFEEAVGPSTIPWTSRSGRMEMREEVGNDELPGHSRPHSVGEFEFKQLKSRSFQDSASSSNSSMSLCSRMTTMSPSVSPEESSLKMENLDYNKDLNVGCDSILHSTVASGKRGLSRTSIEARGFSIGSSSELDMQKRSEDDFEDFSRSEKQHLLGRGKPSTNPVRPDAKPSSLKMGNLDYKKDLNVGCDSISHLTVASGKHGLPRTSIEARGFSIGSSSELDMQKKSEDDFEDFSRSEKQHLLSRGKPSTNPVCPDAKPSSFKVRNLDFKKDLNVGCDSISHSTVASGKHGLSHTSIEARGFSIGSSSELDMQKRPEHDLKDFSRSEKQHLLGRGKPSTNPVHPDAKPSNLKMGNLDYKKDLNVGCDSISHSTVACGKNGLSRTGIEARGFSIGSSSELYMQKRPEDDFEDFSRSEKQHLLGRGKPNTKHISPDAKPSNLSKILSRAKSVRTFRSGRYVMDKMKRKENYSNQIADKVGAVDHQFAAPILVNTQTTGHEDPPVYVQNQNSDKVHPVMDSIFPKYENREKEYDSDLASEEDSESQSESNNDQNSSDENENVSAEIDDEDLAGSEVDRKADEFIAKFREQIRLQKIASVRKHNGC